MSKITKILTSVGILLAYEAAFAVVIYVVGILDTATNALMRIFQ